MYISNSCLIRVIEIKMAPRTSTKEKILDVAEGLFAEHGFNDTSLRTITGRANVNLASVNYHFGDKKTLVRAVLDRYLEALMPSISDHADWGASAVKKRGRPPKTKSSANKCHQEKFCGDTKGDRAEQCWWG